MPGVKTARRRVGHNVDAAAEYLRDETVGGAVLLVATVAALIWANASPDGYLSFWERDLTIGPGSLSISEDLQHWVNDGLMALFFFVVALEIKRELTVGELSDRRAATVPVLAALGGAALPIVIFWLIASGGADTSGWAIPMATDIAFAVGVLALLGDRIPAQVRVLLLTIAVVDDVVAIAVIALFFSSGLSVAWLALAVGGLAAIAVLRAAGVPWVLAYAPLALAVWVGTLESGVHATMAGVALGLLVPARPVRGRPVLERLEHRLHPLTAYLVVPLFALANAGVVFSGDTLSDAVASRLVWAIAVALVVGKLLGVAGTVLLVERLGGRLPDQVRHGHVWGIAALSGIGFTVSLFIAQLAYEDTATVDEAKIAIFAGSIVSAAVGLALLLRSPRRDGRAVPEWRPPPRRRR